MIMNTISTKQHNFARDVTEDTLQSLNLKTDDNFYEYVVLIVGIHDHQYLFENLPKIISKYRVKLFNDIESSLTYIHSLSNTSIFLIISGTLGQDYIGQYVSKSQIIGIYVYCLDESKHTLWTKEIDKIRCTVSDATQLLIRIHGDIKELSGRWPFEQRSFQKALTNTSQWYHIFLLVICYRTQYDERSYNEMFDECRAHYRNNPNMLQIIEQFQQTYESNNAILEYTRDSFLYRIVNHALRTQNMETIRKFSPFIRDLNSQLHDYHGKCYDFTKPSIRAVYRGQYLSLDELDYLSTLCKSRNPIITMTTFSSTSLNPEIAMSFVLPTNNRIPCLFEIIITDEYNIQHEHMPEHQQVFANISSLSAMPYEQEVLFSLVTHFCVKYIQYPVNLFDSSWVLIVLELITDKHGECSRSHFDIIDRIKKETNPQIYNDILYMLEVNATDEMNFKNTNWQKWWNNLKYQWGTGLASDQPLNLIFYNCFTDNKYWSRKAIEMHKNIQRSIPVIQSNQSSFSYLFEKFKAWQKIPTTWLALYEEYLKPFCTKDTKEVIQCLRFAGETYKMIGDIESALECYQNALDFNVDDKYKMNNELQKQIKILNKPSKPIRTIKNQLAGGLIEKTEEESSGRYKVQREEWSSYWTLDANTPNQSLNIKRRLERLLQYFSNCEDWYDKSDAKIFLRLSYGNSPYLSIENYYSNFLSAVEQHISSSISTTDPTNNRFLSHWRYGKYMGEWTLFKELEQFLQPFQEKSRFIRIHILSQLERLLKKLNVLITLCIVYICTEQTTGTINMNNLQFINLTDTQTRQLIFFDLHDNDLLAALEAFQETTEQTTAGILPTTVEIPMTISDFIEKYV